jgi:hypothetical protein
MTYAGYVFFLLLDDEADEDRRFFVNIAQIPPVLRWLRYFSTLGYTLEALAINEVGSGLQIVVSLSYLHLSPEAWERSQVGASKR